MWDLKKKTTTTKLTDTENRLVQARGRGWEAGDMGECSQKVQTSHYRINKTLRCDAQPDDYS